MQEFSRLPMLFWDGHVNMSKRIKKFLEKYQLPFKTIGTTPQVASIVQAIYHDIAFGLLPGDFYTAVPGVQMVAMPDELARMMGEGGVPIYAYWNKDTAKYEGKKLFINYLKSISIPF